MPHLPPGLAAELKPLLAGPAPARLARRAARLEQLRAWTRRALARAHLVPVAAALTRQGLGLADLDALGLPRDLLRCFPGWRRGSRRGFCPASPGLVLPPVGAAEPLGDLRLQLSPIAGTIAHALVMIRDLLRATDPDVRLHVVVEPGADHRALARLAGELHASGRERVRFVNAPCISVFAQDNARAAYAADGEPVLLLPRGFRQGQDRAEDQLSPAQVEQVFGVRAVQSSLYWEGGNLVNDGERCVVGVDTVRENMTRLGLTQSEVLRVLAAELGGPVTALGDLSRSRFDAERGALARSGQASLHIDMDLSLLGRWARLRRPRALVADPAHGLDLLPAVLARRALFAGQFLPADRVRELVAAEYDAHARERHPQLLGYAEALEQLGYRVIGMPDLRIDLAENLFRAHNLDFLYCNVLPGLRQGRPAVHHLHYGIPALDRVAADRLRQAGLRPVRVSATANAANALMLLRGGLRCFCGQMPRAGASQPTG